MKYFTKYITSFRVVIVSIIVSLRAYNSYNLFAERVLSLEDVNINIFKLTYNLKIDEDDKKNNKKDNDILIIIKEKINDEKKDYSILFKNNSTININA